MLIIFSGLPGTGKSTVARRVAERLQGVWLRIDTIEQAIRSAGEQSSPMGPEGYFVAYGIARDNLRLGLTVVADSVNPLMLTRDAFRDIAVTLDKPLLEVEIICADRQQHQFRVESRVAEISGHRLPDWQQVLNHDYQAWQREPFRLDSSLLSAAECAEAIVAAALRILNDTPGK